MPPLYRRSASRSDARVHNLLHRPAFEEFYLPQAHLRLGERRVCAEFPQLPAPRPLLPNHYVFSFYLLNHVPRLRTCLNVMGLLPYARIIPPLLFCFSSFRSSCSFLLHISYTIQSTVRPHCILDTVQICSILPLYGVYATLPCNRQRGQLS